MRGTETAAPFQVPFLEWQHQKVASKEKLKIAVSTMSPVYSRVSQSAIQAVEEAIAFLTKQGHEVIEIPYPVDGELLIRSYYQMNGAETAAMFTDISQALKREITKFDMEQMTWAIYQYGKKISAERYIHSLQSWDTATNQMEELFQTYDLFLSPTTAHSAPKITDDLQSDSLRERMNHIEELVVDESAELVYEMFEKGLILSPYTQLANLTGQPAISLPTFVTEEHMPFGIQFMAARGREDLLFQVGELFEQNGKFCLPEFYKGKR